MHKVYHLPFTEEVSAKHSDFVRLSAWGYAMLMSPNKDKTAVHHCPGDMAMRMRKVLAIPRSCVV